jgi:hypothetical protein
MTTRETVDAILLEINTTTLTDYEYAHLNLPTGYTDRQLFDCLAALILGREGVSNTIDALEQYFVGLGFTYTAVKARSDMFVGSTISDDIVDSAVSNNIYIGGVLDE